MSNESTVKTFIVATALCVVCAIIVSLSDVALKGMQLRNKALDKQVNILRAAGLVEPTGKATAEQATELFANAKAALVDMKTGAIVEEVAATDADSLKIDPTTIPLDKAQDIAKIKELPSQTVVYLFNDASGALDTVVLPIQGTGLWSTLYGFISLKGDLTTIGRIVFYEHGETPGLGGEISNPNWIAKFEGKKAFDETGNAVVKVIKGTVDPTSAQAAYQVDGISGATLTCNGVNDAAWFWLGENGFGAFLNGLKNGNAVPQSNAPDASEK